MTLWGGEEGGREGALSWGGREKPSLRDCIFSVSQPAVWLCPSPQ